MDLLSRDEKKGAVEKSLMRGRRQLDMYMAEARTKDTSRAPERGRREV
jgi:hypothetical protein